MSSVVAYSSTGYIIWGVIWLALLIFVGLRTLRRGHWVMFIVGLFIPLFWLIGAFIPPKN